MTPQTCGNIIIHDIGIPSQAVTYVGPGSLVYYPHPQDTSHKGDNGKVLVVAGGPYTGAPALVGLAALRTGADLVFIATPETCWPIVASFSPNLIVYPLQGSALSSSHIPQITNLLPRVDTVVIGPGLGHGKDTIACIPPLVQLCIDQNKSLVIDANAITPLRDMHNLKNIVVTPHPREFKNLTGEKSEEQQVKRWAKKLQATFFVKGHEDLITDGYQVKRNQIHNVGMTVGGTGDVLSGIIGALLGKKINPFHAACMGAFLNGMAGNIAYETLSYGLLATDIVDRIPLVLKNYL
jgi:NAD(P)H-hydrate epimerase